MSKQEELTKELIEASKEYYNNGQSSMSDIEFDSKIETLKKMEKESGIVLPGSPTLNVGVKVDGLKTVKHEYPALSLDKVKYKDRENLAKWIQNGNNESVIMWKLDGSTVVLTYDNGELVSAVTRGNGEEGSDITHNARFFKGIPTRIALDGHIVVRGEAMMTNEEFDRINTETGEAYENARNLATATIQMLDANESRKREIIFKAFELVCPDVSYNLRYMDKRLAFCKYLGFDVVDAELVNSKDVLQKIEEWKDKVQTLSYPTDGLVFSYNDLKEGWALGSTGHHPRWAMALKWTDETVETTVRDIEWSVGKTGLITPVAIFDEVRLGLGSNVTRASLHNISIMKKLGIKKNCKANVYLANLIIPQIASCEDGDEEFVIPDTCPVCGKPTRINNNSGIKTLCCDNESCPTQQVGKLMNTFGKDGLFIKGLGESQIEDLIAYHLVDSTPLSFYTLSNNWKNEEAFFDVYNDDFTALMNKDGWGKKKWENIIDAIEASRKTTLQKFLYSLNIPLLGNDLSKKLSKYWDGNVKKFMEFVDSCIPGARWEKLVELTALDGIGEEKALNLIDWATSIREKPSDYINLTGLISELHFESENNSSKQTLSGMTFVITGNVYVYSNRDEFKASVEARGGKVSGSVSAKTTCLVNNDVTSTSGKNQKAKELGIEIISEDEFIARFGK